MNGIEEAGRGECEGTPEIREAAERLERLAAGRVQRGLAPPKEIYELPYRDLIDWSWFPGWARPSDPEQFQGCAHEG
jgi:hypothetical protein